MSPIERAARALCTQAGEDPDTMVRDPGPVVYLQSEPRTHIPRVPQWRLFVPNAQAVLRAIREPSEDDLEAAGMYSFRAAGTDEMREFWHAMIDAALAEAKE